MRDCPMCTPGARGDICLGHPKQGCPWCVKAAGGPLCHPHHDIARQYHVRVDEHRRIIAQRDEPWCHTDRIARETGQSIGKKIMQFFRRRPRRSR